MDKIKEMSRDEFIDLASSRRFDARTLNKDYCITLILYLIKDVKDIYFKGGTALHKIFLNYARLSEDIDLTLTRSVDGVKDEIIKILVESGFFGKIAAGKDVEGYTRLLVNYKGFLGEDGVVAIDLNQRAKLMVPSEKHEVRHFYEGFIPKFFFKTLSRQEMVAEKIESAIARNKPRDHFDIYMIIKKKLPIDIELVKKKCTDAQVEFDITKMFNNAGKLKNRWGEDLVPLLSEEVSFTQVMQTLAKHFKLKEAKENKRQKTGT